jgi:hypothetical protein
MWIGDNCHTYDRHNFDAQSECGIGNNYNVLDTVLNSTFNLKYYPYIQGDENYECMQKFVYNSYYNVKVALSAKRLAYIGAVAASLMALVY